EDTIVIDGIEFRFIDTAGIRDTKNKIETEGIRRAYDKISIAKIVLLLFDLEGVKDDEIVEQISLFEKRSIKPGQKLIAVFNKSDRVKVADRAVLKDIGLFISAK